MLRMMSQLMTTAVGRKEEVLIYYLLKRCLYHLTYYAYADDK